MHKICIKYIKKISAHLCLKSWQKDFLLWYTSIYEHPVSGHQKRQDITFNCCAKRVLTFDDIGKSSIVENPPPVRVRFHSSCHAIPLLRQRTTAVLFNDNCVTCLMNVSRRHSRSQEAPVSPHRRILLSIFQILVELSRFGGCLPGS